MRILLVTQTYAPDANGQSVFTTRLAEELARRAGCHVGVLLPAAGLRSKQYTANRVTFYRIKALVFKPWHPEVRLALASLHKVTAVMRAFRPDIVHLQDHYPLAWAAFRAARRLQIPVIGTNHFLPENIFNNLPIPAFAQNLTTHLLWKTWRITYDHLDLLTAPTPTAVHILQKLGVRPAVLSASCGVDLAQFHPRPELDRLFWRRKYGLAPDKPIFIFVGRVDYEKRLDVLLQAAKQASRHDFQVVIVGKGLHLKLLRHLSLQWGVQDKVIFTGYAPASDLPYLLNSADIFVMPSEAELQSIATLEAMASGLPVLAANKHALPELVTDDRNGYLFPPGDVQALVKKMMYLLTHPERWEAMGRESRQMSERHDLSKSIDVYLSIYRQTLAAHDSVFPPANAQLSYTSPETHE